MKAYKTKDFDKVLLDKTSYIEEVIRNYLPEEKGEQKIIFEAMNYSVLAGGKRLRPMLMMESYLLFAGNKPELIHPFMAAIEMIHNYSLVHDDLPAMDNDEYRRGQETTHIKYGETIGILSGDGLLNYAFETAIKSYFMVSDKEIDAKDKAHIKDTTYDRDKEYLKDNIAKALQILSQKAGIYGMIGGQVIDTYILEGKTADGTNNKELLDSLNHMYDLKTSALIQASMMIGAVLAGANDEELSNIEKLASHIGIAFQIQDDILDVTSTTEKLGKPVFSDERNEKLTYVSLLGLDKAKEMVTNYSEEALNIYDELARSNPFLADLINKLINREK